MYLSIKNHSDVLLFTEFIPSEFKLGCSNIGTACTSTCVAGRNQLSRLNVKQHLKCSIREIFDFGRKWKYTICLFNVYDFFRREELLCVFSSRNVVWTSVEESVFAQKRDWFYGFINIVKLHWFM